MIKVACERILLRVFQSVYHQLAHSSENEAIWNPNHLRYKRWWCMKIDRSFKLWKHQAKCETSGWCRLLANHFKGDCKSLIQNSYFLNFNHFCGNLGKMAPIMCENQIKFVKLIGWLNFQLIQSTWINDSKWLEITHKSWIIIIFQSK